MYSFRPIRTNGQYQLKVITFKFNQINPHNVKISNWNIKKLKNKKVNTSGLVDEEERVAGSGGKRATGESVFCGFLIEVFDVCTTYVCSPCFLSLSRTLCFLPHLSVFLCFSFLFLSCVCERPKRMQILRGSVFKTLAAPFSGKSQIKRLKLILVNKPQKYNTLHKTTCSIFVLAKLQIGPFNFA